MFLHEQKGGKTLAPCITYNAPRFPNYNYVPTMKPKNKKLTEDIGKTIETEKSKIFTTSLIEQPSIQMKINK